MPVEKSQDNGSVVLFADTIFCFTFASMLVRLCKVPCSPICSIIYHLANAGLIIYATTQIWVGGAGRAVDGAG
jgi:hypothetical protein